MWLLLNYLFKSFPCTFLFGQDVSDRIEKERPDSPIVVRLETAGRAVVRTNWRMHISAPLQIGTYKYTHVHILTGTEKVTSKWSTMFY